MVSIILPNYNHEKYLDERIESILKQTYRDWELIILDDCSADKSRDIINKYKLHPQISHIVINEHNSGSTFAQWEKGISLAKGEYIWIAESDDVADPNFLFSIFNEFGKFPDAEIAFTDSLLIDSESRPINLNLDRLYDRSISNANKVELIDSTSFLKSNMLFFNRIYNASSVVFKKNLWSNFDKKYRYLKLCGDWICWITLISKSKQILHIHNKLNHFRQHTNKVTSRSINDGRAYLERMEVIKFLFSSLKLSRFKRLAIIGRGYHMINTSNLTIEKKKEIKSVWELSYPVRIKSLAAFYIHKILNSL